MNAKHRAPTGPKPNRRPSKARKASRMGLVPQIISIAVLLSGLSWGGVSLATSIVEKRELTQTGVQAPATVTQHHKKTVGGRTTSVYHLIDYTFTPIGKAEEHPTEVILPSDLWNTVEAGSTIMVTYNASNPADNQPTMILKRLSPFASDMIGMLVGIAVAVVFTWFSWQLFRVITSRRRKPKTPNPGTRGTATGTAKPDRSKVQQVAAEFGVLALLLLIFLAILAAFFTVFVCGIEFVGPLVVELMQNSLL
ncbi:MAG: DUF3592 domain-containing protein [Paeniglutamicibacter sp.]